VTGVGKDNTELSDRKITTADTNINSQYKVYGDAILIKSL